MSPSETGAPAVEWEPALVESVVAFEIVCRAAGGDPALEERYHRARNRAYAVTDEGERRAAFDRIHREFFTELGLGEPVLESLARHPAASSAVDAVMVASAPSPEEEAVDLSSPSTPRSLLGMRLSPRRFTDRKRLSVRLDHELTHVDDMIDPSFGFEPQASAAGPAATRAREQIVRARYGALWAVSVDGRLEANGREPLWTRDEHVLRVARLFPSMDESAAKAEVDALRRDDRPTHGALLERARRRGAEGSVRGPGMPCPLCGFPTFVWAPPFEKGGRDSRIAEAMLAEFPAWSPEDGVCARCFEAYEMRVGATSGVIVTESPPERRS